MVQCHNHWMNVSMFIQNKNLKKLYRKYILHIESILCTTFCLDIHFLPGENKYKPVIYMNDFWNMQRDYQPLNDTVEQLNLKLTYQPISLFKWQLYAAQSVRNKWTSFMGLFYNYVLIII